MPTINWNEIEDRALKFSKEWANVSSEKSDAQSFWNDFFYVFGKKRRELARFEQAVKKLNKKTGFIDLFWEGVLIVEHKSTGKNLEKAYSQALDYFEGLKEEQFPRYILVSDFTHFRLYDLDEGTEHHFTLADLHKNITLLGFIAGYERQKIKEQDPVNIKAAEHMAKLHDRLKESGYTGHKLELYLVRLLFCLFAEDTNIFGPEPQKFQTYIEQYTKEDGSDLGLHLAQFFEILNEPKLNRQQLLDQQIDTFPYVNGKLFEERLKIASFNSQMRQTLLDCCALDWSKISPAIFGSLFQAIMNEEERHKLGAHYTTEENILKVINSLFLDELRREFKQVKENKSKLNLFYKKLRSLKFLDPACGCGNFLVIAYRELRLLELDVLKALALEQQTLRLDLSALIQVNVDQFYGIEVEEFPAQIAQVALWLVDHQMNLKVSEHFGETFARIPLQTQGNIIHGNALQLDWQTIIPAAELSYIMGNPPFLGKQEQSKTQKADLEAIAKIIKGYGKLDYVAAWYIKATQFMKINPHIRTAFVSTNSLTQGEQVGVLWSWMLAQNVNIFFAHRTFQWHSEARGKAAVHCVIVGFALIEISPKYLFEYQEVKGEPYAIETQHINPYLIQGEDILLDSRKKPICDVKKMRFGNMPNDGGHLLLDDAQKEQLLEKEPQATPFIKRFISADEFLNGSTRWCIWLHDVSPEQIKKLPSIGKLVGQVKTHREKSKRPTTQKLALTPTIFGEIRQPKTNYLLIPRHTSENRRYIPIGFFTKEDIVADSCLALSKATFYEFGILTSLMHNIWVKTVCGRLKSDYRYSVEIVYNNFPWPLDVIPQQKKAIEKAAQLILKIRSEYPQANLAALYHPLFMPLPLVKAHEKLDKAVDEAYGKTKFNSETDRVAFLFELYQKYKNIPQTFFPTQSTKPQKKKLKRS